MDLCDLSALKKHDTLFWRMTQTCDSKEKNMHMMDGRHSSTQEWDIYLL